MKIGSKETILVAAIGMLVAMPWTSVACDNKTASESVGACYEPEGTQLICDGQGSTTCSSQAHLPIEVNEDFPTDCVQADNSNCNQPLVNCYQPVTCEWVDGQCQTKAGSGTGAWVTKKKRTGASCGAGG